VRPPPRVREIHAKPGAAFDAMRRLDRSARMPALIDVSGDFGAAMRDQYLVLIGCGAVGLAVADIASRLGVARLLLVDPAPLKPTSVLTHPCHPNDLGRSKAIVAAERAKAVSPETRVFAFEGVFDELPTYVLAGASHLLLASDNLRCEASVSQRTLHLGIPVLQGSVYGRTLSAQVRSIVSHQGEEQACLCCEYTEREWQDLDRGTIFSCSGTDASPAAVSEPSRIPTASLPHLCGIAANLLWTELTRRVLAMGGANQSRLVEFCGYNYRTSVTPLRRRADCPMDHSRLQLEPRAGDLGKSAPRDLLREAGYEGADPCRVSMTVEGRCFTSLAVCGCDVHPQLGRFFPAGGTAGACPRCRVQRLPHPLHSHEEVPVRALASQLDSNLESLGAPQPTSVRVRGERGAVLFHRRFAEAGGQEGAQ
jgi:molybdopterin/thiamine biosynthesis adenylyltransferase